MMAMSGMSQASSTKRRAVDNFFKAVNKPGASPRDEPEGPRDDKMRTILQRIKRVDD